MKKNDALLPLTQNTPVESESPEELFALLRERAERYTMGDSTSIPVETARRLTESIVYCADLNRRFPDPGAPADAPLSKRWRAGVSKAKRLAARAKLLMHQARRMPPPVQNIACKDTLDALPAFFRSYDADFFAHEIPCSFDYPLCHPVTDTLLGAEYIAEYLRRLLTESQFLRAFPEDALRALYKRYYDDCDGLLVNLYLPAAEMAILCALAERPVRSLSLDADGYAAAGRVIAQTDEKAARATLLTASERVLGEINVAGAMHAEYMRLTALDLMTRLRAAAQRT